MTNPRKGHSIPLSPGRKMVLEILHHGRKTPTLPLSKDLCIKPLFEVRKAGAFVSWTALFMKAYGLVAMQHPPLRRAYIPYPYPRLYEHPLSECGLILERDHEGENIVLGAKLRGPELQSLVKLDQSLTHFRSAPLHEVGHFRQWLRVGRLPFPVRRFIFWHALYFSGYKRAKHFGTFAISSLGNMGVEQHHPISPLTTYLTFGPISSKGQVTVKLIYDHRVMDGRTVARALNDLEMTLNTQIRDELKASTPRSSATEMPSVEEWGIESQTMHIAGSRR